MAIALHGCTVCGQRFEVRYGFQIQALETGATYFCSQKCHEHSLYEHRQRVCSMCEREFELRYAFQQVSCGQAVSFFCSTTCRSTEQQRAAREQARTKAAAARRRGPVRLAVINQKGGTGKTTTAVNVAGGLAAAGYRTLIVDLDAQGHVGTSLGAVTKVGIYQLMIEGREPRHCVAQLRPRLHAIVADERLANVELALARMETGSERVLGSRLARLESNYDAIVIDCGPALSLLNVNALTYAEHVIVPVSCDFLSLVGVKQMLRTLERVNRSLSHRVEILGIVPTFYDRRNRISDEAVKTLQSYFRDKVLPPIRVNTKLKEAPQHKQTIFEYAPKSSGARDYGRLVAWIAETVGLADTEEQAASGRG